MLKLYNLDYSKDIVRFGNSTYNLAATFRKVALYYKAAKQVRKIYKTGISRKASATYTVKNTIVDVFNLADKL